MEMVEGEIDVYTMSTKPMRNTLSGRDERVGVEVERGGGGRGGEPE